jgi:hypothetical protein
MNPEQDLEKLMDRELRSLPVPRAPGTLAPRVMAAITARAALPWHRRTWFEWPRGWQVASAALTVAFLTALMTLAPWRALPDAEPVSRIVGQARVFVDNVGETGECILRIAVPLWSALAQQFLIHTLVGMGALVAAVVILGGAARQLVLKEIRS